MSANRIAAFVAAGLLTGFSLVAFAQTEFDALRYSALSPQGTARSMGFGNALGSVGGDFSSLSVNPAGIGIYRSSEIMFTPVIKFNSSTSTYGGTNNQNQSFGDNITRFSVNNVGVVFTKAEKGRRYSKSNWKAVSFGFGINRVADFNRRYTYQGYNNTSSFSENFVADANQNYGYYQANGRLPDNSYGSLGYNTYLVDTGGLFGNPNGFGTIVQWDKGTIQRKSVTEKGGISEMALSFGGNYKEKLMLGATVGIPILKYVQETSFTETNTLPYAQDPLFGSFTYNQNLTTTGLGINLKLGFIYKINDYIRIGGAFHTPTAYSLIDNTDYSVTSDTRDLKPDYYNAQGAISSYGISQNFNYSLTTPWRAIGSVTGMLGKIGFVTADYEYVDYTSLRYHMGVDYKDYEAAVNQQIKNTFKSASNIRAGVELRFDQIAVRGGFGYYGNPYQDKNLGTERYDFSAGLGFRFEHSYIDLAYVHSQYTNQDQPYVSPYSNVAVPTANVKNGNNNIALTLGFKF
jgi:hypothetical protein